MWYFFFNQNCIILRVIFFWKSLVRTRDFKKALFYFLCLFHNWKPEAFSHTLCNPAYKVQKLNVGCKNSKMHVGDKTYILEVQALL